MKESTSSFEESEIPKSWNIQKLFAGRKKMTTDDLYIRPVGHSTGINNNRNFTAVFITCFNFWSYKSQSLISPVGLWVEHKTYDLFPTRAELFVDVAISVGYPSEKSAPDHFCSVRLCYSADPCGEEEILFGLLWMTLVQVQDDPLTVTLVKVTQHDTIWLEGHFSEFPIDQSYSRIHLVTMTQFKPFVCRDT